MEKRGYSEISLSEPVSQKEIHESIPNKRKRYKGIRDICLSYLLIGNRRQKGYAKASVSIPREVEKL